MRKCLILILLTCTCQSYAAWFVFAVNETVERRSSEGWQLLQKGDPLFATDHIRMSQYASLSVLDDQSKQVYPLQCSDEMVLDDLMKHAQTTCSSAIARYAKTILSIFRSEEDESLIGSAGVAYRNAAADRIIADMLSRQMGDYAWHNIPTLRSDYRLELQAVSADNGELCQVVREEERVRLLVSNHSNRALFVAVLDVDASGVAQVLLPHDASEMISRMFIPAYSTVMLPEVISFAPAGVDHLYLIAYDEPFDMSHVLSLMQSADVATSTPISLAKLGFSHLVMHVR